MQVLLAEDQVRMAQALQRALEKDGHTVTVAYDGSQALGMALSEQFDILVLDVMLPKLNGVHVVRRLRAEGRTTPTIMLTARDAMSEIVEGLDAGADDYLTKPFALQILLARMRALGRRVPAPAPIVLQCAELTLNTGTREVRRGSRVLSLTPIEFSLLELLLQRSGRVVTREALIAAGWGPNAEIGESTLYVFVRNLREKLEAERERPLLQTARGVGYILRDSTVGH